MKRKFSFLLIMILILAQIPSISLANNSTPNTINERDIIISSVDTGSKNIYEGEKFKATITLENNSNADLEDITVMVEKSSSFILVGTGSKKNANPNSLKPSEKATVEFDLSYTGGEDIQIPITIYYKKDTNNSSLSDYIGVNNAMPKSKEPKPEPIDTTKLIPKLSIVSSKSIQGEAGQYVSVPISIKNTSQYTATDITITSELDSGDNSYLSFDDSGYSNNISRIRRGKTEDIDLKIYIDPQAQEKSYPIKLHFQYYNEHGDPAPVSSDVVYVKVSNNNTLPILSVNKVDITPQTIEAGKKTTVGFEIENKGSIDAKDIKLSLDGLSGDTFILASGANNKYINKLKGGQKSYIYFELQSSNKLAGGSYGLELKLNYKDMKNQPYEDSNKFFLTVASKEGKASNIIIENLTYPENEVSLNKDFNIGFKLKNIGKMDAKNIKVTVESSEPNAVVPKTASIKKINSIAPGKSQNLSFSFLATKDATTRNYPINITVEYEDELNAGKEKYTLTQYVGVYVVKPGEEIKTTPKLIIDKYSFEPALAKAGENFTMNLSFFNTNAKKAVKNIKISLVVDEKTEETGNVFTPVGSSNTFYIDSIPPKGRVEKTITMFTVPDAKAKSYNITANFEYEDSKGEQYTATELIGVPVVQQSKLEVGELNIPTENYVGQPIPIMVDFYNMGKVTLYNTMVNIEGDFQTENGNYYVGNFESGNSETFEGTIIPDAPGEINGTLVFSYDDTSGEHVEIRKDFKLNVEDAPPMDEFPDDMNPDMNKSKGILKSKKFWIILVLIVGGGIGGIKFYKNRKKKKEGMALDE
ncbi:COG1361 S-layer family protein [Sporanaerobacter acetigenes]|uniref:Uncharacterized conserved protein n=1 Tax=Sporanaerobacter acetigenes DSM 13106 TaxID=1123281 RepID=A0A1M5T1B8_9FIRM|nr:CARDB domain-containing protein [Sporanaerobacter acetigenes]SHH44581.1 Uncharacterized conserved protein [Sporanaerobacter acetigenes DSM 13106]